MALKPLTIDNFKWWLNLSTISDIGDNQFQVAKNVFYNSKGQLQTRYGITTFGAAIWSNKPISSIFTFQRDDTGVVTTLAASGTNIYKLDNSLLTWSSIKSWLHEFETATGKTTWRTRWDFAVYKNVIYLTNGVDDYASYDWTTYTEYAQPKYRYINMTTDRLFGTWEDLNPSTVYYTAAAPANGNAIDTSAVVVWGDELGRINGMNEIGNIILAMKTGKVYSIDVTNQKADPIDSQTWGFSDRSIANVDNTLVYLTERWVDTLKQRYTSAWASKLESSPLDEPVRELTSKIAELNLNANCGWYIKRLNNYYITFDTNWDDVPDTTLVYNSLVKAWTQYEYPNVYDYGFYITSTWEWKHLVASAVTDQVYEIETWFTDLWEDITSEIKSKAFDFGEPWTFKTFGYVDITWQKTKGKPIDVEIEVDWVVVWGGKITDDMIIESKMKETLGTRPIGVDTLTGSTVDEVDLYQFVARIPLYSTGSTISFRMVSTGWVWILQKARIDVNKESIDVFGYNNIV